MKRVVLPQRDELEVAARRGACLDLARGARAVPDQPLLCGVRFYRTRALGEGREPTASATGGLLSETRGLARRLRRRRDEGKRRVQAALLFESAAQRSMTRRAGARRDGDRAGSHGV